MEQLEFIKDKIIESRSRKKYLESNIQSREHSIKKLLRDQKNIEEAQRIIRHVAQKTQQELEYKISEVVTLALNSVFNDPYEFNIEFVIQRGKTEAVITFMKDGVKYSPLSETGGGVVDIASFALRVALYQITNPKSRNTIILDEPFHFLSIDGKFQEKAGEMLSLLSKKLKIQFIIVTHIPEFILGADRIFKVTQKKKISEVEII